MPRHRRFRLLLVPVLALLAAPAAARSLRVPADMESLQLAMAVAVDGDTLRLAPGTYTDDPVQTRLGPTLYVMDRLLTLIGEPGGKVILHGGYADRILLATPGATGSAIENIDFVGGMAWEGGGVYQASSLLRLVNCSFRENGAEADGGGLYALRGSLGLEGCVFDSNRAGARGGGLFLADAAIELTGCTLIGDEARAGGALYLAPGGHAELTFCLLVDGSAAKGGWARVDDGFLSARQCTFFGLPGERESGGISLRGELGSAFIETSILCFSGAAALEGEREGAAMLLCCDVYGNAGGDWAGLVAAQAGQGGNLSADPGFCGLREGNFAPAADSPCAPAGNPCRELIGALDVGCSGGGGDHAEGEVLRSEGR